MSYEYERLKFASALGLAVALGGMSACSKAPTESGRQPPVAATADAHEHPTEGPHHGSLIELGNEEYHAELLHDDEADTVTVFLLDSTGKQTIAVEAQEVMINLSHEGQAEQFTLPASPEASDPAGKSSRFTSTDAELANEMDHAHADAQLVVTIAGKQYRGAAAHDHDHEEEHDHDHDH